ncbi:thioredoxin-like protein [Zychaea mexicana]|uniref:thioredoxin-like protein n=1 Tax=Zychaea mexicana TaxID=64656 RepID=UPI0022FE512B|nr:thioredoxin-like protein [Zychaea mexicana]KAI9488934.1 thioredoxin-like protein [Zychaea mexicana]
MSNRNQDLSDIEDDEALFEELEKEEENEIASLRERRIKEIQQEFERRQTMGENSHGEFTEITNEKEFMNITTSSKYVVGHFFHDDFRRCKIMDTHLETLCKKHYQTRFIKINVSNCPFLVEKLSIRVLPCVMAWVDGYAQTKIVGFDDLGGTDGFSTAVLELKLTNSGVLKKKDEKAPQAKGSIFQSTGHNDSDSDYE